MAGIHNVFHVSMIRKCLRDLADHIPVSEVEVEEDLSCVIPPVKILDRSEKVTRRGKWKMVKVQWSENDKVLLGNSRIRSSRCTLSCLV